MIYISIFLFFSLIGALFFSASSLFFIFNIILLTGFLFKFILNSGLPALRKAALSVFKFIICFILIFLPLYGILKIDSQIDFSRNSIYSVDNQLRQVVKRVQSPVTVSLIKTIKNHDLITKFYDKLSGLQSTQFKIEVIQAEEQPVLINQTWKLKPGEVIYIHNQIRSDAIRDLDQKELARAIARVNQDEIVKGCLYKSSSINLDDIQELGFSKFKTVLKEQGISLVVTSEFDKCSLVIVPPIAKFSDEEILEITKLREKVPAWFFISDPNSGTLKQLEPIFNFKVEPAIIIDQNNSSGIQGLAWQLLVNKSGNNPIVANISKENPVVMLMANPVNFVKGESLLYSSGTSWGETNITDLAKESPIANFDSSDLPASQSVLAIDDNANRRMAIVGDLEWIRNSNISLAGNTNLVSSLGRWLINDVRIVNDDTPGIQIISKKSFEFQKLIYFIFCELFILLGIFICRRNS